jgi:hypothetical protein
MCSDCNTSPECECAGGAILTECSCERGYNCPACNHEAKASAADEPNILVEVVSPDLFVDVE